MKFFKRKLNFLHKEYSRVQAIYRVVFCIGKNSKAHTSAEDLFPSTAVDKKAAGKLRTILYSENNKLHDRRYLNINCWIYYVVHVFLSTDISYSTQFVPFIRYDRKK